MSYLFWVAVFLFPYLWYAMIINRRNRALEALASVDVQLKQRLDLIPNILKIAKKFMEHEKSLLNDITMLRTQAANGYDQRDQQAVQEHLKTAEHLSAKMSQLMVAVESYPEVKSDQVMMQAMESYGEAEAHIAAARRFYNTAVRQLNNTIQIFPGSLLAALAQVQPMPFFEAEAAARVAVDADQFLR